MIVIGGTASRNLAKEVSEELDCDFIRSERKPSSSDGVYIRDRGKLKGRKTIIVQSTCYPPNRNYMELFHLLDSAKESGAEKITVVIPYFAYGRQDERFEFGEAVSRGTMVNLIEGFDPDEIFLIDLHAHEIESPVEIFGVPAYNLTAATVLAEYIEEKWNLENPIFVGPDEEAKKWAKKASETTGSDWSFLTKNRLGSKEVEITSPNLKVEGREVVLIDDVISTGNTMAEAIQMLKTGGAKEIYAACIHPVLSDGALENIQDAGAKEVLGTNTIESEISKASTASLIADAVRQ